MKRILCVALAAVMLLTAVPVGVSSEEELLLTILPVEEEAPEASAPAASASPAPAASPVPVAEKPAAEEVPGEPEDSTAATPVLSREAAPAAPETAGDVPDSVPASPVEPEMLALTLVAAEVPETQDVAPASEPVPETKAAPLPAPVEPAAESVLTILDDAERRVFLTVSDSSLEIGAPCVLRFSAPGADEMALYADGEVIFSAADGEETSLTQTLAEEGSVVYLLRARFGEEWAESDAVRVTVKGAEAREDGQEVQEATREAAALNADNDDEDTVEIVIDPEAESVFALLAMDGPTDGTALAAPGVTMSAPVVKKGTVAEATVHVVANATSYRVQIMKAGGGVLGEQQVQKTKDFKFTIATQNLSDGLYTARVTAMAEGYTSSMTEATVRVATISLAASASSVSLGQSVTFTMSAPGAASAALLRGTQTVESWTGTIPATYTDTPAAGGNFTYSLRATYSEGSATSDGVPVTVVGGGPSVTLTASAATVETGSSYTLTASAPSADSYTLYENGVKTDVQESNGQWTLVQYAPGPYVYRLEAVYGQDTLTAEATVTVTAGKGKLAAPVLTVPDSFTLTDSVRISFASVTNATSYLMAVYNSAGKTMARTQTANAGTYQLGAPGSMAQGTYRAVVTARAAGYEEATTEKTFTVGTVLPQVTLTASSATVETGAAYTLTASAPQADGYVLFENDVEIGSEKDGTEWSFTRYAAGPYAYRLEAGYGQDTYSAETTVTVNASKGVLAAPAVTMAGVYELTETVRMGFTAVTNAETYLITVHNAAGKLLARTQVTRAGTYQLGAASVMGEGSFRATVTAQAAGYDAGKAEKTFTVVPAIDRTLTLAASKTAVATLETYTLTLTAPGASALELTGVDSDGKTVFNQVWNQGGTQTVSRSTGIAGKVVYTPRALFGEEWTAGDPVTVQATATKGDLDIPTVYFPYQVTSGQSVTVTYSAVPNATAYALRMVNAVTGALVDSYTNTKAGTWTVNGLADGHYRVEVEAQAAGYNAGVSKGSLHVGAIDQTVTISVAAATVSTGQAIELTINAPDADALRLYKKVGSAEETLADSFDYTASYRLTQDTAATLTLRVEGLINGNWVKSNTVTVTVTAPGGSLAAPVLDAPTQTKKGDTLIFTVNKVENAAQQNVTIAMKTSTTATTVYSGTAASKTFKIDTSRMQEGLYVITATATASGYNPSTASVEVYIGTPATPTPSPSPTPTATAKATATAKPTATAKKTKKPSSGGSSSRKTATPSPTPKPTATPTPSPTPILSTAKVPGLDDFSLDGLRGGSSGLPNDLSLQDEDISYRVAESIKETYGMDVDADLEAAYAAYVLTDALFTSESGNKAEIVFTRAEELLTEEELERFNELDIVDRFLVMLSLTGIRDVVNTLENEGYAELTLEAELLVDEVEERVSLLSPEARAARNALIEKAFHCPSVRGGEYAVCIDVSIFTGFSTRYERYAFALTEDGWLLDQIYIGTLLGG